MKYKIIITGGHHNSALVVAKELAGRGADVEWIGHRYAAAGDRHDSAEYVEVQASGIPFHNLIAGKSALRFSTLIDLPFGFVRANRLIRRLRPDAVLSFGGYLGLTVSIVAWVCRIPVFLHEQTAIAGKANKVASRFARRIYLTWPSSRAYYPSHKSLLVGLPLRPAFVHAKTRALFANRKPTILVIGGKQGSHTINQLIFANLAKLLTHYNLIHQTGTSSATGDYEKAVSLKSALEAAVSAAYDPRGYIAEDEIADFMKNADLVIGRSGAHTTYELGVLGKPCILIPFLSTHGREQLHNARLLEKQGLAVILPQSSLSYSALTRAISSALSGKIVKPVALPLNAGILLADDLEKNLKP